MFRGSEIFSSNFSESETIDTKMIMIFSVKAKHMLAFRFDHFRGLS